MELQSSISLVMVNDGLDGGSGAPYFIQSNYDEILRFESMLPNSKTRQVNASPEVLIFQVFENAMGSEAEALSSENWKGFYSLNRSDFTEISSGFMEHKKETNSVEFDFIEFLNAEGNGEILSNWNSETEASLPMFKFVFLKNNLPVVSKVIIVKNGVANDLAKLNICANGIYQSVLNTSLNFNANGLELDGADFKITGKKYTKQEEMTQEKFNELKENLYYKDANFGYIQAGSDFDNQKVYFLLEKIDALVADTDGNLVMTGKINATGGSFTGEVHAQNGEFSGTINATGGSVGGFTLTKDTLTSSNGTIVLDGTKGQIVAGQIELGTATLSDKLTIGEKVYLCKPKDDGKFLEAGTTKLYDNGKIELGNLELYGGTDGVFDGYIRTNSNAGNGAWAINEDGSARFDNITVNEAKIRNSVLEVDTVQTVGSRMVFKESLIGYSYTSKEANEHIVFLEGWKNQMPEEGEWIWDGAVFFCVEEILAYYILKDGVYEQAEEGTSFDPEMDYYIRPNENENEYVLIPPLCTGVKIVSKNSIKLAPRPTFSRIGKDEGSVISILGANSIKNNFSDFAIGNTLTIAQINEKDNEVKFTPQLVLGNLNNFEEGMGGYGLYCDNVHLNGTLSTGKNQEAGISTKSNATFIKDIQKNEGKKDESEIIFWGGATSKDKINEAPFQVTKEGTLYAQQAIITGRITGSEIYGSTIYGAELRGWNENQSAALSIYDTSKGIEFKTTDQNSSNPLLFKIGKDGLSTPDKNFITIDNNSKVQFYGDSFSTSNIKMEGCIYFTEEMSGNLENHPHIGRSSEAIHIGYNNSEVDGIRITQSQIKANSVFCANDGVALMHGNDYRLEYRMNQDGQYDLYVY